MIVLILAVAGSGLLIASMLSVGDMIQPARIDGGGAPDGGFKPYALIVYPTADTEIGYTSKIRVDIGTRYVSFVNRYSYTVPVKYLVHDGDGDLKSYSIEHRIKQPTVGNEGWSGGSYSVVDSDSFVGTIYDREITSAISFSVTDPSKSSFSIYIEVHFDMVDQEGNTRDEERERKIICTRSAEDEIEVPENVEDDPIIEDNVDDPEQDPDDYFDDPLGNFEGAFPSGIPGFEFLFAVIPIIYLIRKKRRNNDNH